MSAAAQALSKLLLDSVEAFVAPVWASRGPTERAEEVDHNGTISFVDLGARRVGITAHHVIAKLRKKQAKNPNAGLAMNLGDGVTPFFRHVTVIDEDQERDIAIISFPDLPHWQGHRKAYFPFRYPIEPTVRKDAVTIVGYPGALRRAAKTNGSFTPHGICMTVSNDPGNDIMLVNTDGTLRTIVERTGATRRQRHVNPGGMSGSAGFYYRGDGLRLAGFVYEGSAEMLFLVPASGLEPDGRIQR